MERTPHLRTNHIMRQEKYTKYFLLAPALLTLTATTVYPLVFAFITSFRYWRLDRSPLPQNFIGFDNYLRAFGDPFFLNSVVVTLIFTAISVTLSVGIGLAIALLLHQQKGKFSDFLKVLLILPFAVSPALKGFSWRFMLDSNYGVYDKIIDTLLPFLSDVIWLGEPFWAMFWLAFTEVWGWAPFIALVFLGALGSIDDEVIEAAKIDRASPLQIFWHVTLPLLVPIILIVTLLKIVSSLKMIDQVIALTGGGPGRATQTLNYYVYVTGFKFFDMGYASALAFLLGVVLLIFAFFYIKLIWSQQD